MLELDGADGGGQLVRTALALSAATGTPFEMTNVRGDRSEPGFRPQHATAVGAAAAVCDADVEGGEVGDDAVTFEPGDLRGGEVTVDVGTAGSLTLVFDTVLPVALRTGEPVVLDATGGTDVKWAPPLDFYRRVKLSLLREHGLQAVVDVDRRGFYPVGGGRATLRLAPSSLSSLDLVERGASRGVRVYSTASESLADAEVAERQARAAVGALTEEAGLEVAERVVRYVDSDSPGSAVVVRHEYAGSLAGFDALGEKGKPAEDVAGDAVGAALRFHAGRAAVDRHLADQLLVFLALARGRVSLPRVTDHVDASLALLEQFGFDLDVEERDGDVVVSA